MVHTDLQSAGSFVCSDDRINRLHAAAVWSFRDNACDIPTDCPTRERAGWTGDWQLYVPTASYLYDVAGFSVKWLRDLVVEQWADGNLGNMAPMPVAERTGFLEKMNGSAGWGDAIVLVPWELYEEYGDTAALAEELAGDGALARPGRADGVRVRHPRGSSATPSRCRTSSTSGTPASTGASGWSPAASRATSRSSSPQDKSDVATAFYAWSTRHAAGSPRCWVSTRRPRGTPSCRRTSSTPGARSSSQRDGRVRRTPRPHLVRALTFGLVPDEHRQASPTTSPPWWTRRATTWTTGFLATPDLLPVLADHGHLDAGVPLALPGLRALVADHDRPRRDDDVGALERHRRRRRPARVAQPLLQGRGDLVPAPVRRGLRRLEPTWRRFRVEPMPGGGITSASTEHLSPHGRIAVSWTMGESLELSVTVPPGCVAEVVLPQGSFEVGLGSHRF